MKWVGIILPVLLAGASYRWVPVTLWIEMNQGLLAFLGLLVSALVQVIPVTANFLQADHLTPIEAKNLSDKLSKQQKYWIGLLATTIFTFVVVVIVSILKDRTKLESMHIDIGPLLSALVTLSLSFIVIRMIGVFQGVISLQTLRSELVLSAAKRKAAEQVKQIQSEIALPADIVPNDYGKIIHPNH